MPATSLSAKNHEKLRLDHIDILNFKNIQGAYLDFAPGVNCLLGMNGMGKSNMLEAVHFLSLARPMSALPDSSMIRHGEESMLVKGSFVTDSGEEDLISVGVAKGRPKKLKRNGKDYKRVSEHIGRYPVVSVTPSDSRIATGGAEERRRLMDMVISQADPVYLDALMKYGHALESRNRLLRTETTDLLLYESIEAQMAENASIIHEGRKKWLEKIAPIAESLYSRLAKGSEQTYPDNEKLNLTLSSRLNEAPLPRLLDERRSRDLALGYTTAGPHRDDLLARLDSYNLREIGSQGQLKTFTVALKLAVFDYLKSVRKMIPILLLDDIFDKLDASRVENIMKEVSTSTTFGQIFITDTNRKHLDDIIATLSGSHRLFNVSFGEFTPS